MRLRWLVLPFLLLWGVILSPTVGASTYVDIIAGQFTVNNHVVIDSNAKPMLTRGDEINAQIGSHPIYVANIAAGQSVTPKELKTALSHGNPNWSGTVVVISSHGYEVQSYNVSKSIADATLPAFGAARDAHKGDLYGTISQFVTTMINTPVNGPPVATTQPVAKPTNWAWAWALLYTALGAIALVASVLGIKKFFEWRAERNRRRDEIDRDLITGQRDVDNLSDEVVQGASDVSDNFLRASNHLTNARTSRRQNNLNDARAHLDNLRDEIVRAERKLNPTVEADTDKVAETPEKERKEAHVTATGPNGREVTITNNDYRTTSSPGYRNYYAGGMYNGMYFYPGYYPWMFWGPGYAWDPVNVILMDDLLMDRWGGDYHTPVDDYVAPSFDFGSADSDTGSYGFDDSSHDTVTHEDSSDHSYSFSDDDDSSSSYSAPSTPSYDSSSSSSSSWDSGSSSFDFGSSFDSGSSFGGGSDSGGGSFGF